MLKFTPQIGRNIGLAIATLWIPVAGAQITTDRAPDNRSWVGIVTVNDTYVRCGANESYYPIATASQGDLIRIRGKRQDWLKIDTDGSVFENIVGYVKYPASSTGVFSIEGTTGTAFEEIEVLANNIDSEELYRSWRPIYRLGAGDTVEIITTTTTEPGTLHREAYVVHTVHMPTIATAWVHTSSISRATDQQAAGWGAWLNATSASAVNEETKWNSDESSQTTPMTEVGGSEGVDTEEDNALEPVSLVELEARWEVITSEPVLGAEVSPLRDMYQELLTRNAGDLVVERIAAGRIKQLDVWNGLQQQRIKIDALRSNLAAKTQRVTEYQGVMATYDDYAVAGRLALSNTFDGQLRPMMYRVQDPKSGRTLGYLPANSEWELSSLVGQEIGVKGEATWNPHWRINVIRGTSLDLLSPATVTVPPDIQ